MIDWGFGCGCSSAVLSCGDDFGDNVFTLLIK